MHTWWESILGLNVKAVHGKRVSLEWTDTSGGLLEWWHDPGVPLVFPVESPAGQVGGFVPQYLESEQLVKNLFSRDKYIFLISQGGSEGSYLIKLLLQLGYDGEKIYNVGGVSHNEGIASYKSIKSNKYYVEGNGTWKAKIDYDYLSDLTPIN